MIADPWRWWSPSALAAATGCELDAIVEHWPTIAAELGRAELYERDICRGVLATIAIETASTFRPIDEYPDWRRYPSSGGYPPHYDGGAEFHGRGFVQLTHIWAYAAAGLALGVDLVGSPALANEPAIAVRVLVWFWQTKRIPSKDGRRSWTLAELCAERDWYWLRVGVQGGPLALDRLVEIVDALGDDEGEGVLVVDALRVTEDNVNLRERPELTAPILYVARAGDVAEPLGGHTWRKVRVGGRDGWMSANYLEAARIEPQPQPSAPGAASLAYDPTTPTELQRQDWTCSIRSVMWMLKSLGVAVTPEEAQDAMSPRYVTPKDGLLDASGAGIVQVLHDVWGIGAYNDASATFDEVAAVAGRMPVAIGLRAWGGPGAGHWSAVRGFDGSRLLLANPGGTGAIYGQQTFSRQEFDNRGPASMVVVPLGV